MDSIVHAYTGELEQEMTTDSSILAWKILWLEESGGLQCIGGYRELEQELATDFSILAQKILWSEESGGLQAQGVTKSWM